MVGASSYSPAVHLPVAITWADEVWHLLPERAIYWPRRRTLVVADTHFGKAATFRAAGVPVPEVIRADLEVLTAMLSRYSTDRLIFAGDLLHAAAGRTAAVCDALGEWRVRHSELDIALVRGNHDARAGDPPDSLGFRVLDEPAADAADDGCICFVHHPDVAAPGGRCTIGGHLHPAAVLSGGAGASLRAPCFWFRRASAVLPAFGRFTGCSTIAATAGDRVFVIGDAEVIEARTVRVPHRASSGRRLRCP